ncbi:probable 1-deoxy-D-xylulose-5-phosphate synthase 2, chloroplastic, partial [Tanacetum coccineum]
MRGSGSTCSISSNLDPMQRVVSGQGASMFEELELYYAGTVDGHNLDDLVHIFKKLKSMETPKAVLVHIVTEKGKGYHPTLIAPNKMHGMTCFTEKGHVEKETLVFVLTKNTHTTKQQSNDKIVAIHAAVGGGTSLNTFQKHFPERCFDVAIAEQHAVTFAVGLATEGLKPFCAIYSSFLQRGYDQ